MLNEFESLSHAQQLPLLLDVARRAVALYDIDNVKAVELINLSENATYKITQGNGQKYALRLHRAGYHSKAAIASELAWIQALRRDGVVTTPKPVPGRDGALIHILGHPQMREPRHIVMFEWEAGLEPRIDADLSKAFETLGEAAARMHMHVMTWTQPEDFVRHTWNFETALGEVNPHWGRWRDGIGVTPDMGQIFARTVAAIGKRLKAYGTDSTRFGLVHGDLRLANLLCDGDAVKVIDFDDCGFSWFMYDAATPVSFYEHEPQVPALIESWKTGYRRVRTLSAADEAEIPTFVMFRRLLLVAWIGSRRETDLAKSMGLAYSLQTIALCENYLAEFE
jgi:Ser/Thr protein kinase RdoA (MazF antagonist)